MENESNKPTERTPIVPLGEPGMQNLSRGNLYKIIIHFIAGPSYVFPGREPRMREKRTKELQCCICTGIM